jgi:hypothetical protein
MNGRPRRQFLVLPDDPHRLPDREMRVECRRFKVARGEMLRTADLSTVQTSLDTAMAAQSYHQGQITQLSYAVAQLQEQLNTFTAQQVHDEAAHPSPGTPTLNPTATPYSPLSSTPVARVIASSQEQLKSLSEKQSLDTEAQIRETPLKCTANAYCPQSPSYAC